MTKAIKIIKKLKNTLELIHDTEFSYRDIAKQLNIKHHIFVQMVFRNKIPYQEICDCCCKNNIDIQSLFYNEHFTKVGKMLHNVKYFYKTSVSLDTGFTHDRYKSNVTQTII